MSSRKKGVKLPFFCTQTLDLLTFVSRFRLLCILQRVLLFFGTTIYERTSCKISFCVFANPHKEDRWPKFFAMRSEYWVSVEYLLSSNLGLSFAPKFPDPSYYYCCGKKNLSIEHSGSSSSKPARQCPVCLAWLGANHS